MITIPFFSKVFATIGSTLLIISTPLLNLLSPTPPTPSPAAAIPVEEQTAARVEITVEATSTPIHEAPVVVASSTVKIHAAAPLPAKKPEVVKKPDAPVTIPAQTHQNAPTEMPPLATTVATTTQDVVVGTTTLAVASIPLLSGGVAHAGQTVPVSYLQITNTGKEYALLKGFWLIESGSALAAVVTGLSTVDDHGGSRGSAGGVEGSTPFNNGSALVPTNMILAPGQMRLFTIKATLSRTIASYQGTELKLEVSSVDSTALATGVFPIRGTTWVIAN